MNNLDEKHSDYVIKDIEVILNKYLAFSFEDIYHRYKSWEHCYTAFAYETEHDLLALHLGFYLASWGMYRGSSGLLQKNHKVHLGAVSIIKSGQYISLQCNPTNEMRHESISLLFDLKKKLSGYYRDIKFSKGGKSELSISPTETLISKIILGTLGCVPAYDRYFTVGMQQSGLKKLSFEAESINALLKITHTNSFAITNAQRMIKEKTGVYYPFMKILDMYFWQKGYDFEQKKK